MQNYDLNSISVNDVLSTLKQCECNRLYAGMYDHMLAFASELTGISVDGLLEEMDQSYPREAELHELQVNELIRDNVKVEWEAIGEGLHGDYNPMDPNDVEFLRFYVSVLDEGEWMEKEDSSRCTQFPVSATAEEKFAGLEYLLDQFHEALSSDMNASVKKLADELSWISPSDVSNYIKPQKPTLSDQIQSASIRSAKILFTDKAPAKETTHEH